MKRDVNLIEIMFGVINTQSSSTVDYTIAHYILEHVEELDRITLSQLAERCQVSKASVSRFCRKIGMEDYLDMQIMNRLVQWDKHKFDIQNRLEGSGVEDFLDHQIRALEQLKLRIDFKVLRHLTDDIYSYKNVAAFGHMQSGNICFNLQQNLVATGKLIDCTQILEYQREYLKSAGKNHLILVFTARGKFFERLFYNGDVINRRDMPRIYMITTKKMDEKQDYIYRMIELADQYDYINSSSFLETYEQMIAMDYYERYGRH